ncbi:MAG: hypothetical protein R8G66_24135 [Cytophagales bacterium]|nr:hypothetical protein [Cytophagales bacterium]
MEFFFDKAIGCERVKAIYNKEIRQADLVFNRICVFDLDTNQYMSMPIFLSSDSPLKKDSAFQNTSAWNKRYLSEKYGTTDLDSVAFYYRQTVELFHLHYSELSIPKELGYSNIFFT